MQSFRRTTYTITYGCGHQRRRSLPTGPGTPRVIASHQQECAGVICDRCAAWRDRVLASGATRWDERY